MKKTAAPRTTGRKPGRPPGAFKLGVDACRNYLERIGPTHVRPHNRTIAKALRRSERQVCRYLKHLAEEKLLRRQTRKYFHVQHHKFLTARVLITLKFQSQPVFGEPWYGDPAPNLKLDDDVKEALSTFPAAQQRDEERQQNPEYLAKKNRLMAALRTAQAAAGGDNREARANPTIRNIMRALQELSS